MPPTTRGAARQQAARVAAPARLSPLLYAAHAAALPLFLAMFAAGVAGMVIIMDEGGSKPLSQTAFAANWRWLIGKNAFFQPFAVNFGAIGAGYCIARLVGHHRATAATAAGPGAKGRKAQ